MSAGRDLLARGQPGDTRVIRLEKRLIRSSAIRYRARLLITHLLEPYSRRRAAKIAATSNPLRLNLGSYVYR
jgi:hypothetical protein